MSRLPEPVASELQPGHEGGRLPAGWKKWLIAVLCAYAIVLLLSKAQLHSDAFDYAQHIVDQRNSPLYEPSNPFWNFGHVLWKILGYAVWSPLSGPLAGAFGGNDLLAAGAVLIGISLLSGMVAAVCFFLLLARSTQSCRVAAIVTGGFLTSNAVLSYQLTGMAYVSGVACQVVGLYLLHLAVTRGRATLGAGVAIGLVLGLSVVIWLPYILSVPGVLCYALLVRDGEKRPDYRQRIRFLAGVITGAAALILVVYAGVMLAGQITSVQAVSEWITKQRHGKLPNRALMRLIGCVPRAFVSLGEGNVLWKRLLFESHGLAGIPADALADMAKVPFAYLMLALSAFGLYRFPMGRRLLIILTVAAVPVAIFAAFFFEAAPPERFLGVLPLLFLAFGWILAEPRSGTLAKSALALFMVSVFAANMFTFSRFREPADFASARVILQQLNSRVSDGDRVMLESYQDPVSRVVNAEPFSPLSKNRFLFEVVVPFGTAHPEAWPRYWSTLVLGIWEKGGRVWISNRFHAEKPDPAWAWIEGDDLRLRWADFHAFFEKIERRDSFGDVDGFSEIVRNEANQRLFDATLAASKENGAPPR